MTSGNVRGSVDQVDGRRRRWTPSTQSAALPSAGCSSSSSTVAETVTGSPNGEGEAGSTVTVVVVRSADPSAYSAAMSSALSVEV